MTPLERQALWSRYLEGPGMGREDQVRLLAELRADESWRRECLEDLQLDGSLRALGDSSRSGDTLVAAVGECLDGDRDATRFIRTFEARCARSGLTRSSRRFFRSASGQGPWPWITSSAAGFLAVLLIGAALSGKSPRAVPAPEPGATAPEPLTSQASPAVREKPPLLRREDSAPRPELVRPAAPGPVGDRATIEARMKAQIEAARRNAPAPSPGAPPSPSTTAEARPPVAPTPAEPLRLERMEGNVYVGRGKVRVKPGSVLPPGEELEIVGASSSARLRQVDGTQIDAGPNTILREDSGRILLVQGSLLAKVVRRSSERPLRFLTAHAEATVLGTVLRIETTADPRVGTLLEVREGRVRLTRLSDGASVEVGAGQWASAAAGAAPVPRVLFPDTLTVNFGPADTVLPAGVFNDSGAEYDPRRGYGWTGPQAGEPIPGQFWIDPGLGKRVPKRAGREAVLRDRSLLAADPLRATDVVAGWGPHTETWRMDVPNGFYLVTVCVGDNQWEQGPHHVVVEDRVVVNRVVTRAGKFHEPKDVLVEVRDGELTMVVGGRPGNRESSDGSTDTILNFLILKRVPERRK